MELKGKNVNKGNERTPNNRNSKNQFDVLT
jgi:hypothetical protein